MTLAELDLDTVFIWRGNTVLLASSAKDFQEILSTDERKKAERFRFEKDRLVYVLARGHLRSLLAGLLDCPPASIQFLETAYGKPFLDPQCLPAARIIHFNVSHSGSLFMIALSLHEVGIDVEFHRTLSQVNRIAERFFCPEERMAVTSLALDLKTDAFYRIWTRKEAFIKAVGQGLSYPLSQFSVLDPSGQIRILWERDIPEANTAHLGNHWFVTDLDADEGYSAALATLGRKRVHFVSI